MAKMSEEDRIKEVLEYKEYTAKQGKIMRDYALYINEKGFTIESQRTKLCHLRTFFKQLGKDLQDLKDDEIQAQMSQIEAQDMKTSMEYFMAWFSQKEGLKDFEAVQGDIRQRRILAIKNYPGFNPAQKALMDKFYGHLERKGLRQESKRGYMQNLKLLMLDMGKDLKDLNREDIDQYLLKINKYKKKTQTERRKFLLLTLEWIFNKKKEEIDLIKDIKIERDRYIKLPEEILSPEEIKKIVQVADNFRDKALVILLYETGARKGEFLQLKIKHLELDKAEYGLVTIPIGKTDSRKIPIIYSVPYIQNWLNAHPRRDDPEAPLFINHSSWLGRALGEDGLKRILKVLAKRAGIKKKIFPHIFRHSRLTELGKELTEQELKKFAGWVADSGMTRVYVHLSGEDVTNKILANAGLIDRNTIQNGRDVLMGINCPRCQKTNPGDAKYCSCGFILDLKEVNKMIEERKAPAEMSRLFEVLEKLQKEIVELKEKGS